MGTIRQDPRGLILFCACIIAVFINSSAYCLYGDAPDCAFQCHCAVASECGDEISSCPGGCATAPLGHNWRGPGCQIGNVGLYKTANMSGNYWQYPASGALDGISPGNITAGQCAHPAGINGAEWWADLGTLHKISSITIYGRVDCCTARLQDFDLTVYNTTDNEVLCAYRKNIIRNVATMPCQAPIVGRYVRFKRRGGGPDPSLAALCEVVITGHRYIDCSMCPSGVNCNDVTGCEACAATYQPDCKTECEPGSYGDNCATSCGQCKSGKVCNIQDGVCPDGCQPRYFGRKCTEQCTGYCKAGTGCNNNGYCIDGCDGGYYGPWCTSECSQNCKVGSVCDDKDGSCPDGCILWYAGHNCKTHIDVPNHTNETTSPLTESSSSVLVRWQHIRDISSQLGNFYYYSIQHKKQQNISSYAANTDVSGYTESGVVPYTAEPFWNITDLDPNTNYVILIIPFREFSGTRDYGTAYPIIHIKTNCNNPDKPHIMHITKLENQNTSLSTIFVHFEIGGIIKPNCHNFSRIFIQYKLSTMNNFTKHELEISDNNFIIHPSESGVYEVQIMVENNQGYKSSSDVYTVDLSENNSGYITKFGFGIAGAIIIALVVAIIAGFIYHRRRLTKLQRQMSDITKNVEGLELERVVRRPRPVPLDHANQVSQDQILYEDVSGSDTSAIVPRNEDPRNPYEEMEGQGRGGYENVMITGPYESVQN